MTKITGKAKKLATSLLRKNRTRTWREIAAQDYGNKIHFSVLNKIAKSRGAYIPSDKPTQYLLGLYKPRSLSPKTITNDDRGQSWTLYMRQLIKSLGTPTPKELAKRLHE
jgi:hypothetical protein